MANTKKKTIAKKKTASKAKKTLKAKKVIAVKKKAVKPIAKVKRAAPAKKVVVKKTITRNIAAKVKPAKAVTSGMKDKSFNPKVFEPKWQAKWEEDKLYRSVVDESKPKHYALTMLPYPSGDLHIGHWFSMTPTDARARFKRMQGYNVLFPMGFDAFGLPAEGAAIKHNIHPKKWTYANIEKMRKQMRSMGAMFDWEREAVSSDPEYYKWTEWFFIQLYKHGLAYRKKATVDWCPKDNTTLAREQVKG